MGESQGLFSAVAALVSSRWPILDIWKARKKPLGEITIDLEGRGQNVLVWRSGWDVRCEALDALQTEMIRSLQSGELLGEVCARSAHGEDLPVGEWFATWANQGLITRVA